MSVLVLFLLAVLGCSVTEGAVVSKCEMKEKITDKLGDQAVKYGLDVDTLVAKIVCHVEYGSGFNTSEVNELTLDSTVWTLYGLFQLSNHLVCNDSTTETHNICNMDCNELADDNTEDDFDCLLTVFKHCVYYYEDLRTMIKLIYQYECNDVKPSEYFKECV